MVAGNRMRVGRKSMGVGYNFSKSRIMIAAPEKTTDKTPTQAAYGELQEAFNYFNESLFFPTLGKRLPQLLITLQRQKHSVLGYYSPGRFTSTVGKNSVDELAMNPMHFKDRTIEQSLSTLVHEMAHQYQQLHGKKSRGGYHNKEWGDIMEQIGLMPSNTGAPGGKRTGQQMSHYIIDGGLFAKRCKELITKKFSLSWSETFFFGMTKGKKKNRSNRVKYKCPECGAQIWGKPELKILCGGDLCETPIMEAII